MKVARKVGHLSLSKSNPFVYGNFQVSKATEASIMKPEIVMMHFLQSVSKFSQILEKKSK